MSIPSEAIRKKIVEFALSSNPDDMVSYLKEELKSENTTAEEILEYATKYQFTKKTGTPYVINENIINKLGVVVNNMGNDQKIEFFKLAADRGSSWGCRNYCLEIIDTDEEKALEYAKTAVDLVKNDPHQKHQHKFTLCKALRKNCEYPEANNVLMEYLKFKAEKAKSAKKGNTKDIDKEVNNVFELMDKIFEEFMNDFKEENKEKLTAERCQNNLEELKPFLETATLCAYDEKFKEFKEKFYYIKAKCHEKLGENREAMIAYCMIKNNNFKFFKDVISARANLLKLQVEIELNSSSAVETTDIAVEKKELLMENSIPFPIKFGRFWSKEAHWFHSMNEKKMKDKYDKRFAQINQLISAKETEILFIEKFIKTTQDNNPSALEAEKKLRESLEILKLIKKTLEEKYKKYSSVEDRQTFRRHTAETVFFDPKRSKKKAAIIELTHEIIEQRFNIDDSEPSPEAVNLTGKSSRQVISAEKVFQDAVISLTGEASPKLGIPTAREKSWTVGDGWYQRSGTTGYGPIETYQVGDTKIQSEHRTSPKRQRLGDSFLPQHGSYTRDIYTFLKKVTNENIEKEKQLSAFMIRYGKTHAPVSFNELQAIYTEVSEDDVHCFNRICFLIMEKEQSQWHSANDNKFQLGMCVAQARCLIMIRAGFISFKEAFKNNVLFGVYSQTGIIDNPGDVKASCKHIDNLYMSYLENINASEHFEFLKKNIEKNHKPARVLTREQAHLDMKEVYGGESDTEDDESGYGTDLSMSL